MSTGCPVCEVCEVLFESTEWVWSWNLGHCLATAGALAGVWENAVMASAHYHHARDLGGVRALTEWRGDWYPGFTETEAGLELTHPDWQGKSVDAWRAYRLHEVFPVPVAIPPGEGLFPD